MCPAHSGGIGKWNEYVLKTTDIGSVSVLGECLDPKQVYGSKGGPRKICHQDGSWASQITGSCQTPGLFTLLKISFLEIRAR